MRDRDALPSPYAMLLGVDIDDRPPGMGLLLAGAVTAGAVLGTGLLAGMAHAETPSSGVVSTRDGGDEHTGDEHPGDEHPGAEQAGREHSGHDAQAVAPEQVETRADAAAGRKFVADLAQELATEKAKFQQRIDKLRSTSRDGAGGREDGRTSLLTRMTPAATQPAATQPAATQPAATQLPDPQLPDPKLPDPAETTSAETKAAELKPTETAPALLEPGAATALESALVVLPRGEGTREAAQQSSTMSEGLLPAKSGLGVSGQAQDGDARTGEARTGDARTGEAPTSEVRTGDTTPLTTVPPPSRPVAGQSVRQGSDPGQVARTQLVQAQLVQAPPVHALPVHALPVQGGAIPADAAPSAPTVPVPASDEMPPQAPVEPAAADAVQHGSRTDRGEVSPAGETRSIGGDGKAGGAPTVGTARGRRVIDGAGDPGASASMPVSPALTRTHEPAEATSKDPVADLEKTLTTVWEPSGQSILRLAESVADLAVRLDAEGGNDHRQVAPHDEPAQQKGEHGTRGHQDGGTHAVHAGPKPPAGAAVPVAKAVTGHDEHTGAVLASPALQAVPGGELTGAELLTWAGGYLDHMLGDLNDFMDHVLDKAETAARTRQAGALSLVPSGLSR